MIEKEYDYKVTAAGRVNIIGEHVDYCGGKVLPAALSLKNTVYIRPNGTNKIKTIFMGIQVILNHLIVKVGANHHKRRIKISKV